MKHKIFFLLLGILTGGLLQVSFAQGTAFMYQGQLTDAGNPANGTYDLRFTLYDAKTNGNAISYIQTNLAVEVSSGTFMQVLDFGAVFSGTNYWLSIGVRTNASTNVFTVLWPRQPVLPVPYAVFANSASNLLGTLPTAQLAGTLSSTQLSGTYSVPVGFTNVNNVFIGAFNGTLAGNGAAITNLNGSAVTFGTVADTRLTTNVALLNTNQTFTGSNTFAGTNTFTGANTFTGVNAFTNRGNSFVGSFFGNGLVGWIPVSNTVTQAMPNAGYLLLSSSLTTVTLPPTSSLLVGDIVRISGAGSGGWLVAQNSGQSIRGIFLTASNASWLAANATSVGWQTLACSADGVKMVAGTSSSGIYTSGDSGKTWSATGSTFSPISLASSADGVNLAGVVFGGNIILSTNSGTTWQLVASSTRNWQCIASSADGTKLVAVVNGEFIYTSTNSCGTWWQRNSAIGAKTWFAAASSTDGTRMAAAIYGGNIYTSADSGVTWTKQAGSVSTNWTALASSQDGSRLAGTAFGGKIYTSSDYGVTWTQQANSPTNAWYSIACSSDGGRLVAAAYASGIYVSADSGINWTKQSLASQNWKAVTCSAIGNVMAAAYASTSTAGAIYYWQAGERLATTTLGATGSITGSQGAAVELQHIGGGQFMPVSSSGSFWGN